MKKILLILIIAGTALTACKKDNHTKNGGSGTLQKVTFEVGFSQTITGFETNLKLNDVDTSLTNNVGLLFYMVFDASGNNLHNVTQQKGSTGFGTFTDELRAGSYTIAIAGVTAGSSIVQGDLTHQLVTPIIGTDLFFKRLTFVVAGSPSTQSVVLERIDSRLKVVVKDAIPSNVAKITVKIASIYIGYLVGSEKVLSDAIRTYPFTIPPAAAGTTNYALPSIDLLSNGLATVDITALDSHDNIVSEKIVNAVTTGKNKVTILTGNLFDGNGGTGGGGFVISLPQWNTPTTQGF